MALKKKPGEVLTNKRKGGVGSIPAKFVAAMDATETVQAQPNDVDAESLTATIVESKVETNRTDERVRTTTTKAGATQTLTASIRTPDGVGTLTEVMTTQNTTTASSSHLTLSDRVENLGNGQEVEEKIAVASFPAQTGQIYDIENDVIRTYTEQKVATATAVGTARTDLSIDDFSRKVQRTWDNATLETSLDGVAVSRVGRVSTDFLPVELLGITTVYNSAEGTGTDSHPTDQQTFYNEGSGAFGASYDPRSSAQGSASIQVDIIPEFRGFPASVPSTTYFFYAALNATLAQLISRISSLFSLTVLEFPTFQPEPHTLVLKGQQVSLRQSADSRSTISVTWNQAAGTRQWGSGESREFGTSIRTKELAPCIHGAITIASASQTATASVNVEASVPELVGVDGFGYPRITNDAIDNDPALATAVVTASVSPSSLSATGGTAAVPSTGLYIVDIDYGPKLATRQYVGVTVVDFTYLS